jgi:adenylate cyclase
MSFFDELKRRNVVRVGVAYIVASWVILQVTDLVLEGINAPDWVLQTLMYLIALGFFAAVIIAWAYEITPDGIKREKDIVPDASVTTATAKKLDKITIGLLVIVLSVFALDRFVLEQPASVPDTGSDPFSEAPAVGIAISPDEKRALTPSISDDRQSVAVLPFVNMSDDAQNEYFSDGISEELLNVLVKIESLRVPSRTSSFTFKGSDMKLSDIGRELGVDHVLEGSVRKAGSRIRVTAQLIDVNTDSHLWSDTYTRELDDIFAVQDEISKAIVQALQVTLSGDDEQQLTNHGTENVEAYNKYLMGRHIWNRRTLLALTEAVEPLKEAVALDPGFEKAWTALADTYALSPEYGVGPIEQFVPLANEAITKALAINPASARALTARGYVKSMYEYNIGGALKDFELAIELEPGYATAHQWYGEILAVARRLDEALEQIEIAIRLDPLAPVIRHVKGWLLAGGLRFEEAEAGYREVFKVDPDYSHTHYNLRILYILTGKYDLARQESAITKTYFDYDDTPILALIDSLENPDDQALRQRALELLNNIDTTIYPDGSSGNAQLYMILGEHERALDNMEMAFEAGDPYAIHMNRFDQYYGPIREHPRFQALLRKMNLLP